MALTKVSRGLLSTSIEDNGTSTAITIDSSENVGIGTTSPSAKLDSQETYDTVTNILTNGTYAASFGGETGTGAAGRSQGIMISGRSGTSRGAAILAENQNSGNAHDLLFATSSTAAVPAERMRISADGKVGIGTASPSSDISSSSTVLEIADSNVASLALNNTTQSTKFEIASLDVSGGALSIRDNNAERMRIDSAGQVGIGTTSPTRELEVSGSGNVYIKATAVGANDSAGLELDNAGVVWLIQNDDTSSDALTFDRAGVEAMRIDSSGQVGIGTASPEATLHIADVGSTGPALHIAGGSATEGDITTSHDETLQIGHWNESSNAFTERMRIDTTGSVGLRTTANVVSSTSGEGFWLSSGGYLAIAREGTTTSHPALYLNQTGVTGQLVQFRKDGTSVGSISTNGSSLPSDRNFKRNIESLDLGLDFVASLNPVTYNYKLDEEGQPVMTGLIAQEVEEALTAAGVEKNSMTLLQHKPTEDVKESDYQMDYLKLVPILINSIKEQQTLIETLETRIAALEE